MTVQEMRAARSPTSFSVGPRAFDIDALGGVAAWLVLPMSEMPPRSRSVPRDAAPRPSLHHSLAHRLPSKGCKQGEVRRIQK